MKQVLRPQVEPEIRASFRWYEERQAGLGKSFLESIEAALRRIGANPRLYQEVHLDIRRAPLDRFPFGVYYALIQDELHVLAVLHDARHPSIWKRRR